jgi:hypothetical protein
MRKTIVTVVVGLALLVGCAQPGTVTAKGHLKNCYWVKVDSGKSSSKPCITLAKWRKIRVGDRWEGK